MLLLKVDDEREIGRNAAGGDDGGGNETSVAIERAAKLGRKPMVPRRRRWV
jgi:hypothetical protein